MSICTKIGEGATRECIDLHNGFVLKRPKDNLDPIQKKRVMKIMAAEIEIWSLIKQHNQSNWFVPVHQYAKDFTWIIMPKGEVLSIKSEIPRHPLTWLDDLKKPSNWVRIDGKIKVCDYGRHEDVGKLKSLLGVLS